MKKKLNLLLISVNLKQALLRFGLYFWDTSLSRIRGSLLGEIKFAANLMVRGRAKKKWRWEISSYQIIFADYWLRFTQ